MKPDVFGMLKMLFIFF